MNTLIKIISLLLCTQFLSAQSSFHIREYFGQLNAVICSVYPTDSIYYVTGIVTEPNNNNYTSSFFARYDTAGNLLSQRILHSGFGKIYETWAPTLEPTPDGNLALAGYGYDSLGMFTLLVKYNLEGDTLWTSLYYNPFTLGDYFGLDDMSSTLDSGFILTISAHDDINNGHDISVIKTDALGQVQWHRTYGDPILNDLAPYVYLESDSTYIISWGKTNNNLSSSNPDIRQCIINRIDLSGNIITHFESDTINNKQFGGAVDLLIQTDGYLIGTTIAIPNPTDPSLSLGGIAYAFKLDNILDWQWGKKIVTHPPAILSYVRKFFQQADSTILAIGSCPDPTGTHEMGFMQKITPNGDSIWQRNYAYLTAGGDWNEVYDARRCPDGGFILCGESRQYTLISGMGPRQQGWLLKVDSMGCLVPGCHLTAVENVAGDIRVPIKVFPNPATDFINVYVPGVLGFVDTDGRPYLPNQPKIQPPFHLHLYDLNGRLLQNHAISQSDATYMLTTEGLESGVYILQLLDDKGRILGTEKVVVVK